MFDSFTANANSLYHKNMVRVYCVMLIRIDDAHYENSFGAAVGQPYWIGEEHDKHPQNATVTELSAIDNPHEAEACFLP